MSLATKLSPLGAVATVMHDEVTVKWPLIRFLLDDPVCRAAYVKELQVALDSPADFEGALPESASSAMFAALKAPVLPVQP